MVMGTVTKCSKEADHHGGPLRRVSDEYVCQECWAKEKGIELKHSKGRAVTCPDCGEVLMTKFRGGKMSITSLSMKGSKAILTCKCGYKKTIPNPFSKSVNRDEAARQRVLKGS